VAWLSLIEGVVVAVAAVASTWILWLTFRSVNAQTELSRRQFTLATSDRFVPQLSVELGEWMQPRVMDSAYGSIAVLVHNLGMTSIKIRNSELLFGDIRYTFLHGGETASVVPGATQKMSRQIGAFKGELGFRGAVSIIEFDTDDGAKYRRRDTWNISFLTDENHENIGNQLELVQAPTS
jgi:hypothetical protein